MELIFCPGPTGTSLTIWDVHMSCSGNISALKCQPWTCDLSPASEAKVNSVAGRNVRWIFLRTWRWPPLGTQKNSCLMGYTLVLAEQKRPSNCGFSVSLSSQKTLNNSLKSRWILWFHPVRSFPALIWDTSVSLDVSLRNLHSTWMSRESVSPVGFTTK